MEAVKAGVVEAVEADRDSDSIIEYEYRSPLLSEFRIVHILGLKGWVGWREREGGKEALLTITKSLMVVKHHLLSGDTAHGRTGSSTDGEYSTPTLRLAMWPAWAGG